MQLIPALHGFAILSTGLPYVGKVYKAVDCDAPSYWSTPEEANAVSSNFIRLQVSAAGAALTASGWLARAEQMVEIIPKDAEDAVEALHALQRQVARFQSRLAERLLEISRERVAQE